MAERTTLYGAATVVVGVVLLVTLRFWTSPIALRITGREPSSGLAAFLAIPVVFAVVALGIGLLLWEPDGVGR